MSSLRIWTCKDGRRISIKDMQTTHIKNTKAMLVRHAENVQWISNNDDGYETIIGGAKIYHWLYDFDAELERRGEA